MARVLAEQHPGASHLWRGKENVAAAWVIPYSRAEATG
jgi:hypothetical protein